MNDPTARVSLSSSNAPASTTTAFTTTASSTTTIRQASPRRSDPARAPTLPTPGGTHALNRSEPVVVEVDGRVGIVRRPNLVGALVMKAAAHTAVGDAGRDDIASTSSPSRPWSPVGTSAART